MDETLSLLYAYAMQRRDQDTSVSENQALVSRSPVPGCESDGGIFLRGSGDF